LLVFAHPEEVVGFLPFNRLPVVVGAFAVNEFALRVKPFTAYAVEPPVVAEVDISRVIDVLQDGLHHPDVLRVGGANKTIIPNIQGRPGIAKHPADAVGVTLGVHPGSPRRLHDLVAVFVRPGEEESPVAEEAVKTAHDVGDNGGVSMPHMGFGIDVVDGGSDVEVVHVGPILTEGRGSSRFPCRLPVAR